MTVNVSCGSDSGEALGVNVGKKEIGASNCDVGEEVRSGGNRRYVETAKLTRAMQRGADGIMGLSANRTFFLSIHCPLRRSTTS